MFGHGYSGSSIFFFLDPPYLFTFTLLTLHARVPYVICTFSLLLFFMTMSGRSHILRILGRTQAHQVRRWLIENVLLCIFSSFIFFFMQGKKKGYGADEEKKKKNHRRYEKKRLLYRIKQFFDYRFRRMSKNALFYSFIFCFFLTYKVSRVYLSTFLF